jgi:uncharacterized phage-like protein YoqJ
MSSPLGRKIVDRLFGHRTPIAEFVWEPGVVNNSTGIDFGACKLLNWLIRTAHLFVKNRCQYLIRSSHLGAPTTHSKAELTRVIRSCYDEGFRRFLSGMERGVDTWAAEAVMGLRRELPDIRLIAAVPFVTQWVRWNLDDRDRWEDILRAADQVWVTTEGGKRWRADELIEEARRCIRERDLVKNVNPLFGLRTRWMVDRSAALVAIGRDEPCGTGNVVAYAQEVGRRVIRIDPHSLRR